MVFLIQNVYFVVLLKGNNNKFKSEKENKPKQIIKLMKTQKLKTDDTAYREHKIQSIPSIIHKKMDNIQQLIFIFIILAHFVDIFAVLLDSTKSTLSREGIIRFIFTCCIRIIGSK